MPKPTLRTHPSPSSAVLRTRSVRQQMLVDLQKSPSLQSSCPGDEGPPGCTGGPTRHGAQPTRSTGRCRLIGVTAVLEGHLLAGELSAHLIDSLNRHLHRAGLVESDAGPTELRLTLANLTERVRYALGEYDEPPPPDNGQVDHYI